MIIQSQEIFTKLKSFNRIRIVLTGPSSLVYYVIVHGTLFTYFSNKIHKGKTCYSEEQVISMLEFLIDNIFVSFGETLFQQVVGIPMGTNCAPLLADLFLLI